MPDEISYSGSWIFNPLYSLYRDKLREYQKRIDKWDNLHKSEILDYLVCLHFCLEFQINNFFREHSIFRYHHDFSKTSNISEFINWNLDKIQFWQKMIMFFYFNPIKSSETLVFISLISRIKNFCNIRNDIFHWSELYSTHEHIRYDEDLNDFNTISSHWTKSFDVSDCKNQKKEYEKIISDFLKFTLLTKVWNDNEQIVRNTLKSFF